MSGSTRCRKIIRTCSLAGGAGAVRCQPTRERRKLVKDFLLNQRFRCDVYVKGLAAYDPPRNRSTAMGNGGRVDKAAGKTSSTAQNTT